MVFRFMFRPTVWSKLLPTLLCALLATAAQAGPRDAPFRAALSVQDQVVPDLSCQLEFRGTLTGSGTVTHSGAVNVDASHCAVPQRNGDILLTRGTITFTAADGDTLTADFMGTISPVITNIGNNTVTGTFMITGGTGRFTDAQGNGSLSGDWTGTLAERFYSGSLNAEGRIGY